MSPPKPHWEKCFLNKTERDDFYAAYHALPDEYQQQVDKFLNDIIYVRSPWLVYKCSDCRGCRKGLYICNVLRSKAGEKIVQVVVWFDHKHKRMVPLNCELV